MVEALPPWFDKNFLALAIQGGEFEEPQITILTFSAEPAVGVGENYTSSVYRVYVSYRVGQSPDQRSITLIVKIPIKTGLSSKVDFFSSEPKVYSDLLPRMYCKVKHEFGPKSLFCSVNDGIIMKDLKADGYTLCDKLTQLDFSHCKLVFVTLAKFHATSVACHHENPDLIEFIGRDCMFKESGSVEMKLLQELSFKIFVDYLNKIGNQHLPWNTNFLTEKVDSLCKSVAKICKPRKNQLTVLNHGDCWINNLMFKYNQTGKVIDVKLLDFQLARYSSPVLDLIFFLFTSPNENVRNNKQHELLKIYLQTLNKTFEKLNCTERYSSMNLEEDLKTAFDFCLIVISFVLPFTKADSETAMNLGDISANDFKDGGIRKKFEKMCLSKAYRSILPVTLKQFYNLMSFQL